MDQHALIPKCPSTLKLVAFSYLAACYGTSLPEEYAPTMGRSRRQRVAINPAALSLLSYGGAFARVLLVKISEELAQDLAVHESCILVQALPGGLTMMTVA